MSSSTANSQSPAKAHRRWRRVILSLVAVAALWLLHVPLLREVGLFLAADTPFDKADYVVILPSMGGDRRAIDDAIERVRRGAAAGLILFEMPLTRSEQCGAWPHFDIAIGDYLKSRGIADSSIVVLPGPSRTSFEAGRVLAQWLAARPTSRLDVLCRPLDGRYERQVLGTVLPREAFAQFHFSATEDRIDATNWWHDREGIQMVFQSYVQLAYITLHGETHSALPAWTLEQYEQNLPPAPPGR
jgi:hypothetical protein